MQIKPNGRKAKKIILFKAILRIIRIAALGSAACLQEFRLNAAENASFS
jgi:hypothetical protein